MNQKTEVNSIFQKGRPQHTLPQAYRLRYAGGIVANKNAISTLVISLNNKAARKGKNLCEPHQNWVFAIDPCLLCIEFLSAHQVASRRFNPASPHVRGSRGT